MSTVFCFGIMSYYIHVPINDTTFELSAFWPSDTESQINRFSESISLSFKTRLTLDWPQSRLTSVTCFCGDVT